MSITPLAFTGVSKFSDDFQVILDRSLSIARIPLQSMQYQQADLLTKKQLLGGIRTAVASLASSVSGLGSIGANRALGVSSTNTGLVTVSMNGATQAGSYTVSDITSVAKAASETSATGYATPHEAAVSGDGLMELVVGTATHEIDLTGEGKNNLEGLRDAINALGAGVTASILNTGTGETPYYLSVTANSTGSTTLQLRETAGEAGTNVLTADNQGADAVFKLNGLDVTKSDNVVSDVISGVSFTIRGTTDPGEEVGIKLSSNRGELATALADFVDNYNALREEIGAQIGQKAGLLSGDFIVREIQNQLRNIVNYEGTGDVSNLMALGIELDDTGKMSFDSAAFYALPDSRISSAFEFLGSASTGFGALSRNLTQISDPITGLIKTQQNQYDVADDRLTAQMTALTERITFMQATLSYQLQQADVLLAQLESQETILDASIQALTYTAYGRNDR